LAKNNLNEMLKQRMAASQQASELSASDDAYQKIFQRSPPTEGPVIKDLPLESLIPFYTADIGFHPYSKQKLQAFSEQLAEVGLLERIIVRQSTGTDMYEILAGHNRAEAAKLAGWKTIPAEIVEADDSRAIVIATSTNLLRRQDLTIIERGKAYKALRMPTTEMAREIFLWQIQALVTVTKGQITLTTIQALARIAKGTLRGLW